MNVLFVHTRYRYKGGEDSAVFNEMELLRSKGVQVDLLEFSNEGNMLLKLVQMPFNFLSYRKVRRKLKDSKADIVHIHNLHFAGSASVLYAIKKSRLPFVITLHNYRLLCPSAILFHKGKLFLDSLKQRFPWKAIAQGTYKNSKLLTFWLSLSVKIHEWAGTWRMCDRYIALTAHSRSLFLQSNLQWHEKQVTVKPNFCSDIPVAEAASGDHFLFVGRLSEEKGVRLLLNVFSSCPYTIKIAGDGPLRDLVTDYSKRFPNIEYVGLLDKDQVLSGLRTCTALIFPSIWYEGMPLTIIEAFACGTPVIASRLGAMENMIGDQLNGLHFEPGDEHGLKACLAKWQNYTPVQKRACRDNARETFEKYYTPEKNFQQLYSIYESVILQRRSKEMSNVVPGSKFAFLSKWMKKIAACFA